MSWLKQEWFRLYVGLCFMLFIFALLFFAPSAVMAQGDDPTSPGTVTLRLYELVGIVLAAIFAGAGSVFGVVSIIVRAVLRSPALLKWIESLADSLSPLMLDRLKKAGVLAREGSQTTFELSELIDEATDGIPADQKTTSFTPF